MSEEDQESSEEGKKKGQRPTPRPFNPLVNYLFYTIIVVITYVIYYLERGFIGVITFMLFFVVRLVRDTIYVIRRYDYKFAKQAAVVNLGYSMFFFLLLVINGIALTQSLSPLIFPDFVDLTSWTPLFIMGGVFGMANIKRMWGPRKDFF
ncbi:hypothetical protein EU527_13900 [Candidatus Thorarchaeota archaeon]|nr:MAG: hypothetical protein EU527_13900 [Candidatus Thorarchaeota archaeon]